MLRWELHDLHFEDLQLAPAGHLISFDVADSKSVRSLFQRRGIFYHEAGTSRLTQLMKKLLQGDGVSAPKWHKCDRHWPVEADVAFEFVGQCYFNTRVVYLFRHPSSHLAIFTDDVGRQDAEEHYREEDGRLRTRE